MAIAVCPYCGRVVHGSATTVLVNLRTHYTDMGQTAPAHPTPRKSRAKTSG